MPKTTEEFKTELCKLPEKERSELAYFLLQTLDGEGEELDGTALTAELDRRMQEIESGAESGIPVEDVFPRLKDTHA